MRRELSSALFQIESTEDEVNQTVLKTVKVECRIKKKDNYKTETFSFISGQRLAQKLKI